MVYTSEKCICMLDANVANTHVSRVTGPVLVVRVIGKHGSTPRVGPSKRRYINSGRVRTLLYLSVDFSSTFAAIMAILKAKYPYTSVISAFGFGCLLEPRTLGGPRRLGMHDDKNNDAWTATLTCLTGLDAGEQP